MIRGSLSHLDLTVKDLSRSVPFYDQILRCLGYRPAPEIASGAPCWITEDSDGGAFGIALVAAKPESATLRHDRYAPGLHHVAFHADSRADVDAFYHYLQRVRATILDPPSEYDYTPGYYAVFFADPDGLKLEVVYEPNLRGREATMSTRTPIVALSIAGLVAPIWFTTLVIVQGILQPDYNHVAMPISALAAWPAGWMQRINFYVFSALMAAFTIAVHRSVQPTWYGVVGIAFLFTSCVGLVIAGLFPWIMVNGVPTETTPHVVGAVLSFAGASIGLIALSRCMAADPRWQSLATYVLAAGVTMLIIFIALGAFAVDDGTPLHPWAGLLQRVLAFIWFACIIMIAFRSLRIARHTDMAAGATTRA